MHLPNANEKKRLIERANDEQAAQGRKPAHQPAVNRIGMGLRLAQQLIDFGLHIRLVVRLAIFNRRGGQLPQGR